MIANLLKASILSDAPRSWDKNQQPVIGIVAQGMDSDLVNDPRFEGYQTYIMASYVKFMEGSGARVVPLISTEDWATTEAKLNRIDGVLFPGGDNLYTEYARGIFNYAVKMNDLGHFYPIWGTCLGMQTLAIITSDAGNDILTYAPAFDVSLPLEFIGDPDSSKMFGDLGWQAEGFAELPITLNNHVGGVAPERFLTDAGLSSFFHPTSISYSPEEGHLPFTATMESYKYPFFGTQFHPEKVLDVYYPVDNINHSWASVELNRYLADKFVTLARENPNVYGDYSQVQAALIENYTSIVTDYWCGQVYVFE